MSWFDGWLHPRPTEAALAAIARASIGARNPSSPHQAGRAAKREIDRLTEVVFARLELNPKDYDLIITGGGTEAMAIALQGHRADVKSTRALQAANLRGHPERTPRRVGVWVEEWSGRWAPPEAERVDGTCALGRVDVPDFAPRLLVLCGARSGGPAGVGALVRAKDAELAPLWGGGGQEHGLRSGTQAVPLVAGWAAALEAPSRRGWLRDAAATLAEALDRVGCEILVGPDDRAAGVVVASAPAGLEDTLRTQGVYPAAVRIAGRPALRFAVDVSHKDDDIEELIGALGTG